jgi:hypothetical protein
MPLTLDGAAAAAADQASSSSSSVWPSPQQLATARAAAKRLLSDQQDNFWLYDAYGCCEAAMGQTKTARKVLESALTLATAAAAGARAGAAETDAAAAAAVAPLLTLHLAQLELSTLRSSKGAAERAHAALHAYLAGEPYNVASAAAAAAAAPGQQQQGLLADKALTKARRGFQDRIPQLLATAGGSLSPAAAATVAAAALFELTVGLLNGRVGKGLDAAAAVYKQLTSAVPESIRAASQQHERLQIMHCHMLVAAAVGAADRLVPPLAAAAAGGSISSKKAGTGSSAAAAAAAAAAATAASLVSAVTPARARSALAAALQLYPNSQPLLNLQVWLDHSCHTLAGLRRQLAALADLNPSPGLWGIVLQAEGLRPGGRVRLRALFERALAAPTPLTWHQQQRLQRQQQQHAWDAALAELPALPQQQQQQEAEGKDDQRQRRLLAAATAASEAAAQLELPLQDSYRGWGSCGSIWLCYIQFELSLGRQEAARRLFLRALHECPGFKALWLSGFRALAEGLNPREASGLMSAMQEREVLLRADVYEVLLADMAEQQQ